MKIFTASSSPHFRHSDSTAEIMLDVIIGLCPAAIYGCIIFGMKAVLLILVCIASSVLAEYCWNKLLKKENSITDLSAVVTGLLLGMNLPSTLPIWMAVIGSVVAIIVVKQMFGGIGHNFVNPAIAARIVLLVSFPKYMTTFAEPFTDAISSATPLAEPTSVHNLFFGMHAGSIGETSAMLLLLGGIYLIIRKVITPVIPLCYIGTFALLTFIFGGNVITEVLSGGLILGAVFMATDYTTSPTMALGKAIFGVGLGILTFVIRNYSAMPEGVSYAILLMNILVPHINKLTLKKPFGIKEVILDE